VEDLLLVTIMPRSNNYNLSFGSFLSFPGRAWTSRPRKMV
jgi:hypothetical protein